MADYTVDIDLSNPNTSHVQVIDLVGPDKTVLDVGCWTGDLARALISRGCRVSGVEIDEAAAERARQDLEGVVVTDLDSSVLSEHFAPGSFDAIVFADVLEHLKNPGRVLADAVSLLADGGRIVISIPNVTHGSLRLALLQGRWAYTEIGLLDQTHIQFFTRTRLLEMVHEAGLVVDDLRGTVADPLGVEVVIDPAELPVSIVDWVRHQPDALVYQFQLAASPAGSAAPVVPRPREEPVLVPGAPEEAARAEDQWTEQARVDRAERQELIALRETVAELRTARRTARERADRARERTRKHQRALERKSRRVRELEEQVAELQARRLPDRARSVVRRLRRS